ncbi:hypothetical protein [Phaeobacter phage MD18]|nr:hypothetical protein [Phaeobacter phage MD18]
MSILIINGYETEITLNGDPVSALFGPDGSETLEVPEAVEAEVDGDLVPIGTGDQIVLTATKE